MRVALIAHVFGHLDGQGRVNYEIAKAAAAAGIDVTLIAERCDSELKASGTAHVVEFPVSRLPSRLLKNLSFALRSAQWLRRHRSRFDIVQANGFITFGRVDVAVAHFVHSAWSKHPNYPFKRPLFKASNLYQRLFTRFNAWQEATVYRQAKRVVAVSRKTAGEVQALGVDPAKLRVLYNGVDVEAYHPGAPERAAFGLPESVPIALFVGDLKTRRKNLELALEAMRHLPELRLAVAGDPAGSPYPPMAEECGVAERVFFLGKTGEVARLMRSVDLFIFPSRYEAHPLVVMEAMASGLPVIVSGSVAGEEDFAQATLVLEDSEDPVACAELVAALLRAPEKMRQLGSAARAYALQMSWKQTAARYLEVYAEIGGDEDSMSEVGRRHPA